MPTTFSGEPDARQAGDIRPSRFRPRYRQLTSEELALHDAIKSKAAELECLFEKAADLHFGPRTLEPVPETGPVEMLIGVMDPAGVYFAEGMTALELAVMWTVKGLTAAKPQA